MKIVLEGPDLSGKTSVIEMLKKDSKNYDFFREPELTIKNEILLSDSISHSSISDILWFAISRHNVQLQIEKSDKKHIILDRSLLSSLVYQYNTKKVIEMNRFYKAADVMIILLVDKDTHKKRMIKRNNGTDRLEEENNDIDVLSKRYVNFAKKYNNILCKKYFIIDTSEKTIEETLEEVKNIIKKMEEV